jgi:hypothetical protein
MSSDIVLRAFDALMSIKDKCGNDTPIDMSDQDFVDHACKTVSSISRDLNKNISYNRKNPSTIYNSLKKLLKSLLDHNSGNISINFILIIIDVLICMYMVYPEMYIFNKVYVLLGTFERHEDAQKLIEESVAYICDSSYNPPNHSDAYEVQNWLVVTLLAYDEDVSVLNNIIRRLTYPKRITVDTLIILTSYLISSDQMNINIHDRLLDHLIMMIDIHVKIYASISCGHDVVSDIDNLVNRLLNIYIILIKCIAKYDYRPKYDNSNTVMGLELIVMINLLHDIAIYTRDKVYKVLKIYNHMDEKHITYQRRKIKAIIEERFYALGGPGYVLANDNFYGHTEQQKI